MRQPLEGGRCVALLDVDHTTIFGSIVHTGCSDGIDDAALQLNDTLLEALSSRGVRDIYFFTDMTLSTASVQERQSLVEIVRGRYDVEVHGILTPCDIAWEGIDEAEAMHLHDLCFGPESVYDGVLYGESFGQFLRSKRDELPKMAEAVEAYDPSRNVSGSAFAEVALQLEDCSGGSGVKRETTARSLFAKALGDHLAAKFGYSHSKSLLLDLFLRTGAPEWTESVVVCDDNLDVCQSITAFRPVSASALRADAPPLRHGPPVLPITILRVTGYDMPPGAYNQALDAHFGVAPAPPPKCAVS